MTDFIGRVDSVYTRQFAATVTVAAEAGASTITVDSGEDLSDTGSLMTPWDGTVYVYEFDGIETVTLSAPLAAPAEVGESLIVWDGVTSAPVVDTVAMVAVLGVDNADDTVEALVSSALIPMLPEGIRAEGQGEAVSLRRDGNVYVVAEILGQGAALSPEYVEDVLNPALPPGAVSDGDVPAENPVVSVSPGIKSLHLTWDAVANGADKVTYDVYAVPAADAARLDAPPLASDLVSSTDATYSVVRALPDGTDLEPETSYAVAVYARDDDGQATLSAAAVTATPAQITGPDIAVGAITVDHLTANNALFDALKAQDITGVNITGSTITGSTIRTADTGNYWQLGSNGVSARIEAIHDFATGAVQKTSGIENVASESDTAQLMGTVVNAGGIVPWTGSEASVGVQASRTRATSSDPWGPQVYQAIMNAHTIGITGNTAQSGDTTPSKITIDANGTGGYVQLLGEKITFNNYDVPNASVEVYSGDLTLSGSESAIISSPTITLDGTMVSQGRLTASVSTFSATANGTAPGAILGQEATPSVWSNSVLRGFTYSNGTWTCNAAGMYFVFAKATWAGDTTASWGCGLQMWKNGAQMGGINNICLHPSVITNSNGPTLSTPVYFAAGDQINMSIWQNSGSAKTPNTVQLSLTALAS